MSASPKASSKKRGRPATGKDPLITVRLPPDMIKALEKRAGREAMSRSEAIRRLIEAGLHGSERRVRPATAAKRHAQTTHAQDAAGAMIDHALRHEPGHVTARRKKQMTHVPDELKRTSGVSSGPKQRRGKRSRAAAKIIPAGKLNASNDG